MTREKLVEIIRLHVLDTNAPKLADKILAALDQERKGEVVLEVGTLVKTQPHPCGPMFYSCRDLKYGGKRGQLIFREQEGK